MKLMKQSSLTIALVFLTGFAGYSQTVQKIGNNPMTLNSTAAFETESTTKGLLPPRMTTAQRDAIATPASGLLVYNTTTNLLEVYNGTIWSGIYNLPKEMVSIPPNGTVTASNTESQILVLNNCNNCNATVVLPLKASNGLEHIIYNRNSGGTITVTVPSVASGNKPTPFIDNKALTALSTTPSMSLTAQKATKIVFFEYDPNDIYNGVWCFYK